MHIMWSAWQQQNKVNSLQPTDIIILMLDSSYNHIKNRKRSPQQAITTYKSPYFASVRRNSVGKSNQQSSQLHHSTNANNNSNYQTTNNRSGTHGRGQRMSVQNAVVVSKYPCVNDDPIYINDDAIQHNSSGNSQGPQAPTQKLDQLGISVAKKKKVFKRFNKFQQINQIYSTSIAEIINKNMNKSNNNNSSIISNNKINANKQSENRENKEPDSAHTGNFNKFKNIHIEVEGDDMTKKDWGRDKLSDDKYYMVGDRDRDKDRQNYNTNPYGYHKNSTKQAQNCNPNPQPRTTNNPRDIVYSSKTLALAQKYSSYKSIIMSTPKITRDMYRDIESLKMKSRSRSKSNIRRNNNFRMKTRSGNTIQWGRGDSSDGGRDRDREKDREGREQGNQGGNIENEDWLCRELIQNQVYGVYDDDCF